MRSPLRSSASAKALPTTPNARRNTNVKVWTLALYNVDTAEAPWLKVAICIFSAAVPSKLVVILRKLCFALASLTNSKVELSIRVRRVSLKRKPIKLVLL